MAKAVIYADNKTYYVAPSMSAALWWLHNDLLKECRAGYCYDIEEINDDEEKALKEKDAQGLIFLEYPAIISEH